jgi:F-type H+/Na+-transporting ATPase subunit alpha
MAVEQQVMIIFAVTNGFLDEVPVAQVRDWERGFHEFMHTQYPQVGDAIRKDKAISKETEAKLREAIQAYAKVATAAK